MELEKYIKYALPSKRWFRRKDAIIKSIEILDTLKLNETMWVFAKCTYSDDASDNYSILFSGNEFSEKEFFEIISNDFGTNKTYSTVNSGKLCTEWYGNIGPDINKNVEILRAEMSNTMAVIGNVIAAKMYRSVDEGINPDIEISQELSKEKFSGAPMLYGKLYYVDALGKKYDIVAFFEYMEGAKDLWGELIEMFTRKKFDSALHLLSASAKTLSAFHQVVSKIKKAEFTPETITREYFESWIEQFKLSKKIAERSLVNKVEKDTVNSLYNEVINISKSVVSNTNLLGKRIRQHGDFHLGQILVNAEGKISIIDYEGEPVHSISYRRQKFLSLKDTAGMVRSIHYISCLPSYMNIIGGSEFPEHWHDEARSIFLAAYSKGVENLPFYAHNNRTLLTLLESEKALYELTYEARFRPSWIRIPLNGIKSILAEIS